VDASKYAEKTWKLKYDAELKEEEKAIAANKKAEAAKEWKDKAKAYLTQGVDMVKAQPVAAGSTVAALLLSLVYLAVFAGGKKEEEEEEEKSEKKIDDEEEVGFYLHTHTHTHLYTHTHTHMFN
jgi:hypothetical protein